MPPRWVCTGYFGSIMAGRVGRLNKRPTKETAMAAQIVGQLLGNNFNRIGHLRFHHLQVEREMGVKCLLRVRIYPGRDCEATDSGCCFRGIFCFSKIRADRKEMQPI